MLLCGHLCVRAVHYHFVCVPIVVHTTDLRDRILSTSTHQHNGTSTFCHKVKLVMLNGINAIPFGFVYGAHTHLLHRRRCRRSSSIDNIASEPVSTSARVLQFGLKFHGFLRIILLWIATSCRELRVLHIHERSRERDPCARCAQAACIKWLISVCRYDYERKRGRVYGGNYFVIEIFSSPTDRWAGEWTVCLFYDCPCPHPPWTFSCATERQMFSFVFPFNSQCCTCSL